MHDYVWVVAKIYHKNNSTSFRNFVHSTALSIPILFEKNYYNNVDFNLWGLNKLNIFSVYTPMCTATTSHSNLFSTYRFYHKLDLTILTPTATMEPLPYLPFLITLLILLVSVQGHSDGPPIKVSYHSFLCPAPTTYIFNLFFLPTFEFWNSDSKKKEAFLRWLVLH